MSDVNVNFPPSTSPFRAVAAGEVEALVNELRADVEGQLSVADASLTGVSAQLAKTETNIINVLSRGVANDGSVNVASIVNTAILELSNTGGGVIYLPKGTYLTNKFLMKSNVTLRGAGKDTVVKLINNGGVIDNTIAMSGVVNVKVENLVIDGNRSNNTNPLAGIYILVANGVEINNVEVKNVSGEGIYLGYTGSLAENIRLNNVEVSNSARNDFHIGNARNVTAKNFKINGVDASSGTIDIEKHAVEDIIENITLENFDVTTGTQPIKLITNKYLGNTKNVVLKNVNVKGASPGIFVSNFDGITFDKVFAKSLEIMGGKNIDVSDSEFIGSATSGIYAYEDTTIARKSENINIRKTKASNNGIHGILLQDVLGATIDDCPVQDNTQAGVGIYYATKNVTIIKSRINDTRTAGSKIQPHAVKFVSTTHDNINIIANNTSGNLTGDFDSPSPNKVFLFGNTSTKSLHKFITPNGIGSHQFDYDDAYNLTWGAFLLAKRLGLTGKYDNAVDAIGNGSLYEDKNDGKLKYKNQAGVLHQYGRFVTVPSSATAAGFPGDWSADAAYFYVCHATNTWKRVAISTW